MIRQVGDFVGRRRRAARDPARPARHGRRGRAAARHRRGRQEQPGRRAGRAPGRRRGAGRRDQRRRPRSIWCSSRSANACSAMAWHTASTTATRCAGLRPRSIDATPPWEQRLDWLREVVLPRLPILLLLDNAEDLLTRTGTGWDDRRRAAGRVRHRMDSAGPDPADRHLPTPVHVAPPHGAPAVAPPPRTAVSGRDPQADLAATGPGPARCPAAQARPRRCGRAPSLPGVPRRAARRWPSPLRRHRRPARGRPHRARHRRPGQLAGRDGR